MLYQYQITTLSTVDEVHASHLPVLDLRAMMVLGAFGSGYIRVKDRAPKVRSIEADTSFFDCVPVTLTLALTLDRADFVGPELYELMQNLELRVRAKKENGYCGRVDRLAVRQDSDVDGIAESLARKLKNALLRGGE